MDRARGFNSLYLRNQEGNRLDQEHVLKTCGALRNALWVRVPYLPLFKDINLI